MTKGDPSVPAEYRSRPVQAVQFTGDNAATIINWLKTEFGIAANINADEAGRDVIALRTTDLAVTSDWVVVGPGRHPRAVSADLFDLDYERETGV